MKVFRQQGFTIVELMVAATLGLLIVAGAISMLISNKRIYTEQDELGRLQENARFAMDMLIRDIRMAGHTGCNGDVASVENNITGAGVVTSLYSFTPVEGAEGANNWQPSNSTQDVAGMLAGSDSITVRYLADTDIYTMTPAMSAGTSQIFTSGGSGIALGDVLAIADCTSADIVVATNIGLTGAVGCSSTGPTDGACLDTVTHAAGVVVGALPGNAVAALSRNYDASSTIFRYVTNRYFVANDAAGNPVLNRRSSEVNPVNPEEVIEGVENMQILYGEDTAGNDQIADTYVTAAAVADWDNVVSVRVSLLMRSVEEYGPDQDNATYDLLGTIIDPVDDRRRRRVFTATIQLRNRIASS